MTTTPGQILLVDCEANRSRLLARRLERQGFTVRTADSLEEAAGAADLSPQLMLIDLSLLCGCDKHQVEEQIARLLGEVTYECPVCGRKVREVRSGDGSLNCCGQVMATTVTDADSAPQERETWRQLA